MSNEADSRRRSGALLAGDQISSVKVSDGEKIGSISTLPHLPVPIESRTAAERGGFHFGPFRPFRLLIR